MKRSKRTIFAAAAALVGIAGFTHAQYRGWGGWDGRGGANTEYLRGNEPMEPIPDDRAGVPNWENASQFKSDVFTLARLKFTTEFTGRRRGFGGFSWKNDWPSGDLNLSFRLQQLTSLKVNPVPIQLEITDPKLFNYPFAVMIEAGHMDLSDDEARTLRRYLLNGGFLMTSDQWGPEPQANWADQMKRIFPDREQVELDLDHPIFHCVFDLKAKPQVPAYQLWKRFAAGGEPDRTWYFDEDPKPHYRAIFDDKGRMMVLQCANNDLSDGWQREGEEEEYFHRFSERQSYPMAINIIFYAMTH
jgi:Domain of unknown function (DUF4159)